MDKTFKLADCSGTTRRGPLPFFLSVIGVLTLVAFAGGSLLSSCTGAGAASSSAALAKVQSFNATVLADASSPAGQQLLADVTTTALDVGLDVASGQDAGAAVAGVQGAASAIRDYEGLPTAPSSATVAQAAAAGAGVAHVATTLSPAIETIIDNAVKSAKTRKIAVTTDQITEALAVGLDQVAAVKQAMPAAIPVAAVVKPGEAP